MVHICRLRNSQVNPAGKPAGRRGRHWEAVQYGDIYVHSKLSILRRKGSGMLNHSQSAG